MTTFEIIVTVAIIAIVMLLTAIGTFVKGVWENQKSQEKKLDIITTQIAGIWRGQDKIENNAAILSSIVDKMHRNLCVEIADKMVDRAYPPTYVTPCYAPNGICTNPQMDCIGCPKRGTGGTWSTNTSIKAEDAPLQEWFNDNKED